MKYKEQLRRLLIGITFMLFLVVDFSYGHPRSLDGSCTAEVEDLNFGSYNPFETEIKRIPFGIVVRCDEHTRFTIKIIGGNSSNPVKRYLYSPSKDSKLYYNIYYNNCPVGDGTGGSCVINGMTTRSHHGLRAVTFTLLGVIPPHQNVPAAYDYQDTLEVIIEY
ncbi:spore coat protein U domain-containing protein [Persephonella sp.]